VGTGGFVTSVGVAVVDDETIPHLNEALPGSAQLLVVGDDQQCLTGGVHLKK
jgi:hypothetical protein